MALSPLVWILICMPSPVLPGVCGFPQLWEELACFPRRWPHRSLFSLNALIHRNNYTILMECCCYFYSEREVQWVLRLKSHTTNRELEYRPRYVILEAVLSCLHARCWFQLRALGKMYLRGFYKFHFYGKVNCLISVSFEELVLGENPLTVCAIQSFWISPEWVMLKTHSPHCQQRMSCPS